MKDNENDKQEEQRIEQMINQAVQAVARGENPEQLLEVMLLSVTGAEKEKLKKRFAAALASRKLRQPSNDAADIPSRGMLAKLQAILAVPAKQAFDKVMSLIRSRPDIAAIVAEAGQVLAANGVKVEKITITEADLGTIPPVSVGKSQIKGQNTER